MDIFGNFLYGAPMSAGSYRRLVEKFRIMRMRITDLEEGHQCANCASPITAVITWTPCDHRPDDTTERVFHHCLECGKTVEEFFIGQGYPPPPTDQPLYAINPLTHSGVPPMDTPALSAH